MTTIKSYKGFDQNWKCRDFQYTLGGEYEHSGEIKACNAGFHACEYPLDVFNYYPPASSRFAEVEQSGELSREEGDSKIASSKIRVKIQLSFGDLIKAAIDYTFSRSKPEGEKATGDQGAASATGYQGAASATGNQGAASATGDQGAASATGTRGAASATGNQGAASATGNQGTASATGYQGAASATGYQGAASATGYQGRAKGILGCALLLVERDAFGEIISAAGAIVGKKGIKPDTFYMLKRGKFVQAKLTSIKS